MKVEFDIVEVSWVEAQQARQAAQAQQTQQMRGHESKITEPGTKSHVAGPVRIDRAGCSLGDLAWEGDWPNLDFSGVTANLDVIDFGCDTAFGLGSLDGIIDE